MLVRRSLAVLALLTAACQHASPRPVLPRVDEVPPSFDHVVVAIDTLARGVAELRALTGLTARDGGPYTAGGGGGAVPARGLRSAAIALGHGRYLELVGPDPEDTSAAAGIAAAAYAPYRRLTPIGWAVRVGDVRALQTAARAAGVPESPVVESVQRRPDGGLLRGRTTAPWARTTSVAPFFVLWADANPLASTDAPAGCTLRALRLSHPAADSLQPQLGRAGVTVDVTGGSRPSVDITLECPTGSVQLPSGAA